MLIQCILHQAKVWGFPKSEGVPGASHETPRRVPRSRHLPDPVLTPVTQLTPVPGAWPVPPSAVLVERLFGGGGEGLLNLQRGRFIRYSQMGNWSLFTFTHRYHLKRPSSTFHRTS